MNLRFLHSIRETMLSLPLINFRRLREYGQSISLILFCSGALTVVRIDRFDFVFLVIYTTHYILHSLS